MPSLDFEMPRKILPIIFCVGKSSNRQYAEVLKDTLSEFSCILREENEVSPDYNIEIVNYLFDDEVISTSSLETVGNFDESIFDNIYGKSSALDFSKLLFQLNDDLTKSKLFNKKIGYYRPTIVFFIDADKQFIYDGLECIRENKWYQNSIKVAVVCNDYSKNYNTILEIIDNNPEGFITAYNIEMLKHLIAPISIMGSITQTNSLQENELIRVDTISLMGSIIPSNSLQDDDLIRVDPINENSNLFNAVLDMGAVNIDGETNIHLCQICACHPQNALDTMFTLTQENESIKVEFYMDALAEIYIAPYGKLEINDCFDCDLNAVNCESLGLHINHLSNCIRIENHSHRSGALRVSVKNGQERILKENDRVLDLNGKCLFEIEKVFDVLPGSTGGEIPWDEIDDAWN